MRGLEKSKRVSWASDFNLCQVRLFLSDESPSQVGLESQDDLQAKSSWVSQPSGVGFDDNLPPGFEGSHPTDLLKNKLSHISLPKWIRPPRIVLNSSWQVVAGEESKEVDIQNQREMRILEAVYPRPSAIPPNPCVLTNLEPSPNNELNVPLITITPIEDEDMTTGETLTCNMAQNSTSEISRSTTANGVGLLHGADPDMVAQAANAILGAVATSNNQVNMVDPELLMKILCDPKWHEKLIANHGAVMNQNLVTSPSPPSIFPAEPTPVLTQRSETGAPSSISTSLKGPFYPPNGTRSSSPPPMAKDLSYYKSLIQQHGAQESEVVAHLNNRQNQNQELMNNMKSKKMKPCMYFNSSRGCRNGASCPYQHDASSMQGTKRVKLDREIIGE